MFLWHFVWCHRHTGAPTTSCSKLQHPLKEQGEGFFPHSGWSERLLQFRNKKQNQTHVFWSKQRKFSHSERCSSTNQTPLCKTGPRVHLAESQTSCHIHRPRGVRCPSCHTAENHASHNGLSLALLHTAAIIGFPHPLLDGLQTDAESSDCATRSHKESVKSQVIRSISLTKPLRAAWCAVDTQPEMDPVFWKLPLWSERGLSLFGAPAALMWAGRQKEINGKLKWMTA